MNKTVSRFIKICANERKSYEDDGYKHMATDKEHDCRRYYYVHPNGNRIAIVFNLFLLQIDVYKNAKLVKSIYE